MHWFFTATVVLFATSCALSVCIEDGIKSEHSLTKRDLSAADAELILKTLLSKLSHGEDSELMQKKISTNKERYSPGPEMTDKHYTAMGHDYMEDAIPVEKDVYEMKKEKAISEKDIMELMMKMKELSASEVLDDPYEKKMYHGNPEEKFISEKVYSSKGPITSEKTGKVYEDIVQEDKFNDKDVSLAESLHHMKIAGDVETYPAIKMAPLSAMHDKKMVDEKTHFEEDHSVHTDEAYLKKVDEIGKSLSKEESFFHHKEDDIEGYLKKAAEVDKTSSYEPKISHPDIAFKTAEDKAIEEWKAGHKDLFAIEGGIYSDEKVKMEGEHHVKDDIAYDELMKKLKSLGLDKELKLGSAHHVEGGISHEVNEELMKKLKESLGLNKELITESDLYAEGDIAHEINDELMKKLKASLGLEKELVLKDAHHGDGTISHEMNDELIKKLKSLDKEIKIDDAHYFEEGIPLEINEDLIKKLKSLGLDKEIKLDDEYHFEEGISHEANDELIKKLKSLGLDKEIKFDDAHHFKEGISHELNDELIKKLKTSLGQGKELVVKGAHHADEGISHEMNDELIKKLKSMGLDKEIKIDDAHYFEEGAAHEMNDELIKKLKSIGIDKEIKIDDAHYFKEGISHEANDELIRKLKSIGIDKEFKTDDAHHFEGSVGHEINDEMMKKLKESLGVDISYDELLRLSKELHKEEAIAEGTFAYEKAKEQAHKDVNVHFTEEELKKHMEEALSFGAKEKVRGTELLFEKGLTAGKAHGIDSKISSGIDKSLDGVYKDEILKTKETHAVDKSIGIDKAVFGSKVPLEAEVKHSIAHDSSFAAEVDKAYKAHEDELLKKEKAYGADSLFHKEKEILESAEGHHVMKDEDSHILLDTEIEKHHVEAGGEKGRKTLHDLKAKFLELLRRVLHMRKCHLVSMQPAELLSIVNCVSRSKDPRLCEKFAACEKKMPLRVITALEKCQKETIPGEIKKCTRYAPLYPSREIPLKIFQCVAINVRELIPQEQKEMVSFEECARVIKAESCGRVKWFRGPH